jgi:hypothetical protein
MKKEIPILFSTYMVQAILTGRKSMTRRIRGLNLINENPNNVEFLGFQDYPDGSLRAIFQSHDDDEAGSVKCPYGKPGDLLWVRESFNVEQYPVAPEGDHDELLYYYTATEKKYTDMKWRPSIHMPKVAARIWLEVTDIRAERLQDITVYDAGDEGVEYWNVDADAFEGGELVADYKNYMWRDDPNYEDYHFPHYANSVDSFRSLWQKINGEKSWISNPWVWVISFKVLSTTGKPAPSLTEKEIV